MTSKASSPKRPDLLQEAYSRSCAQQSQEKRHAHSHHNMLLQRESRTKPGGLLDSSEPD